MMQPTKQLTAPEHAAPALAPRLAGAVFAASLIALGVALAIRPVGDEALRAHATIHATASVYSIQKTWDGAQLLNVNWTAVNPRRPGDVVVMTAQLEAANASPLWQIGDEVDLLYKPGDPGQAVFADPSWAFNTDYRVSAAFQSAVPFSLAALALALLVIWPTRPSQAFAPESIQMARRSLRRYALTPAVISSIAVIAPILVEAQRHAAYSPGVDDVTGGLEWLVILVLIWLCVRTVRFARFRRQLAVVDDAADRAAVIVSVTGRKIRIDSRLTTFLGDGQMADLHRAAVRVLALRGQRTEFFHPGETVRLYGQWERRGPALITDGRTVVIGLGRRRVTTDPKADSLERQYPALRRVPRLYLIRHLCLLVIVNGAMIAVVTEARLNPGWLWLPFYVVYGWLAFAGGRYGGMRGLLRKPYVASQGIAVSVRRGRSTAIELPDEPVRRWILIANRGRWLAEGQEIVLFRRTTSSVTAVIATSAGHAAFAAVKTVQPRS